MLNLEVLQANDGDCLLLHYKNGAQKHLILIDGGSGGVFRGVLEKKLNQLRGTAPKLNMRLAVVSHIDADHITGILDMFKKMEKMEESGREPAVAVQSLWHNAFGKVHATRGAALESEAVGAAVDSGVVPAGLDLDVEAVVSSVPQGNELQRLARKLSSINREFHGAVILAPETGRRDITIEPGLTFTIIGPHQAELDALEEAWKKAKTKGDDKAAAADYLNRTVPNLSSIVFLVEHKNDNGKVTRMLLTGDAGGDLVLKGLQAAGLLDAQGRIKVDVLKVQHHGSSHSVDLDFFNKVIADSYVISGNGKHGIPHPDTLAWLSQARTGEPIHVYMTNRQLINGGEDYTPKLDEFLKTEAQKESKHGYHFLEADELSMIVQ